MAARKRPSLKGRGAEIFLEEPAKPQPQPPKARMPEAPNSRIPESPNDGRRAYPNDRTPESPNTRMPENGGPAPKEKVTFYLPEELLFRLELVWQDLRIQTRIKLSKSDIVQAALEQALAEYQQLGPESRIVETLGLPRWSTASAEREGRRR